MKRESMKSFLLLWYMVGHIILVKTFWPYLQEDGDHASLRPTERFAAQVIIHLGNVSLVWFCALIYLL